MKRKEYNGLLDKIKCSEKFSDKMEELLSAELSEQHEFADSVNEVENAPGRARQIVMRIAACAVVCAAVGTVYYTVKNSPVEIGTESSSNCYADLPFGDITAMSVRLKYGTFDNELGEEKVVQIAEYLDTLEWVESDCADGPEEDGCIELYLSGGENASHICFADTGRVSYHYLSPEGNDSVRYYDFSPEIFGRVQGIILTGSIEGETETPTGEAAEFIESHFTVSDDNPVAVYYADDSQTSVWATFSIENPDTIKELLLGIEWERTTDEAAAFNYKDFYVMGRLLINSEGYMIGDSGSHMYKAKGNAGVKLAEFLKNELQNDKLAYLEYLIGKADETYDTMSADIRAEYTVEWASDDGDPVSYKLNTDGKLYYTNTDYKFYQIMVEGEADTTSREKVRAECMYSYGSVIYAEHGEKIDKINNSRPFFTDSSGELASYDSFPPYFKKSELDYFNLKYDITSLVYSLRTICADDVSQGKVSDHYIADDINTDSGERHYSYYISSEPKYSSQSPEWRLSLEIDENGNIIKYKKIVNEEVVCDFELSNISYDAEDFEYPELTAEQQAYFRYDCKEFAANTDKVFWSEYTEGSNEKFDGIISDGDDVNQVMDEIERLLSVAEIAEVQEDKGYSYRTFTYRKNGVFEDFTIYDPLYTEKELDPPRDYQICYQGTYYTVDDAELAKLIEIKRKYE